ncbi:MAG TPA: peptidoglycan-associated lipoprotein Pal [Gammaproteobacteria bacterium]|nr:peptidoglycan-associated lipoprotein Pal [Gammaproteobacteria bacterium]
MLRASVLIACAATALALTACANRSNTLPDYESGAAANGASSDTGAASTNALGSGSGIGVEQQGAQQQQDLLNQLVVYFDFDTSEIRPEFNAVLTAHAKFLASHPNTRVRLEGHTDERGSREYNIGLGERRAQAVRQVLLLQGAAADQLSTVSYGEERPAATGHDEAAYRMNRRVEIVYQK